jgi:hypothetical protein
MTSGGRGFWIAHRPTPGLPEDLVGVALLLASPASNFITGQTIAIDGIPGRRVVGYLSDRRAPARPRK